MTDFTSDIFASRTVQGAHVVIPLSEYMATQRDWDTIIEENEFLRGKVDRLQAELDETDDVPGYKLHTDTGMLVRDTHGDSHNHA